MDLIPLAELVAEGFGAGIPGGSSRDAIEALARQLDGEVPVDDVGRRCVARSTARRVFTERADSERRQQEAAQRLDVDVERHRLSQLRGGVPIQPGQEDASPLERLGAEHDFAAADERLDAYLSGHSTGRRFQISAEP
jgi:hypothetical protein